jgi:ubiquinone/menaquinone biosynthesis C-methylase UbiE
MSAQAAAGTRLSFEDYLGSAPENYERYFVPAIGAPLAAELVDAAALRQGERVLDVACGTGVVTRLAAERVGASGATAGLDINPGMLGVARSVTPAGVGIDWHQASAEATPFPDESFDAVLCQLGLQFFPDRPAALRELRRVLVPGGRLVVNVPGPEPAIFRILAEELVRHARPEAAGFVHQVFSLHETAELRDLLAEAGFDDVSLDAGERRLRLAPPTEFLWQYVHSTPLVTAVAELGDDRRAALARDVAVRWEPMVEEGVLVLQLGVVIATARKS